MAILVTGGAGYIGSVAVDDLIDSGESVAVIDNLSRGHRDAVNENAAFYEGDIGDRELVTRICREQNVTAVMHFSAFAYVGESEKCITAVTFCSRQILVTSTRSPMSPS